MPCSAASGGGRETTRHGHGMFDIAEAYRMLDTFTGAGATAFDVTFIDIGGQKRGFRQAQTARQLRTSLPHLIPGLEERRQNIIVRPRSDKVTFVQLDDLPESARLAPVSCLILETSPGNHQAWVAVTDIQDDAGGFSRR
jgi:RepB DNA-primase N-terminal domain